MEFKDYYATLGVEQGATADEIKRAYRKLARKYHPDVSKEPDAEARFKDVAEANKALNDPERRAAYDEVVRRYKTGQTFDPPPGWDSGFEYSGRGGSSDQSDDFSDFFASLFGRSGRGQRGPGGANHGDFGDPYAAGAPGGGDDHHAKVQIDLADAYQGARRTISLRMPALDDQGQPVLHERHLDVNIPKGVLEGQLLRLAGQGGPGRHGQAAGDLYLEIILRPHRHFRVVGRDVYLDLPVAPWEAALGATVNMPTPEGSVQLTVPPGSTQGRKLRLKGKGLPGNPSGDLYAQIGIAMPPPEGAAAVTAYAALAQAFPNFNPRSELES
jgi:curved DNA-binding protein